MKGLPSRLMVMSSVGTTVPNNVAEQERFGYALILD